MRPPSDREPPAAVGPDAGWTATVERRTLILESPTDAGDLASSPTCREAAVSALARRDAEAVVVRHRTLEYRYDDRAVALLLAAGRFVDLLSGRDDRLADRARHDPLSAAREATARGGTVAAVAAESGLALVAADYDDVLGRSEPSMVTPFSPTPLTRGMFYEQRLTVPESPAELRAAYEAELAGIVEEIGLETAAVATDVDRETLEALLEDESPDLELTAAAELVALVDGEPDAETAIEIACDHLLLGMSTAVLDVEAVESELAIDLDAKEVQQKIERRAPMSLEEYVHIQHVIVRRMP